MPTPSSPPDAPQPRSSKEKPVTRFHLAMRDFLILILAAAAGVGVDLLLGSAGVLTGQAILGGCAAFAATLRFLDKIID